MHAYLYSSLRFTIANILSHLLYLHIYVHTQSMDFFPQIPLNVTYRHSNILTLNTLEYTYLWNTRTLPYRIY